MISFTFIARHDFNRFFRAAAICIALLSAAIYVAPSPAYAAASRPDDMDPPVSNGIDDFSGLEDAAEHVISLWDAFDDDIDPDASLVFTVEDNTNTSLISTSIDNGLGLLTLSFTANESGSGDITVRATDTAAEFTETTFNVTITSVNDEPSFTAGSDVTVGEDSGAFSQLNWATNISAGPNESSQILTFVVSATNTGLFSVQPSISSTGTLSFTPALNAAGTSTVTVSLTDDGGTTNGGDNESPSQTFDITVSSTNDPPTSTGIPDVEVNEDASDFTIALFDHFDDTEDSDVELEFVVLTNTNTSLVTPSITASTGILTLDFIANEHGSATITIQATDTGGLTASETFNVDVLSVNDAPSFTAGGNVTVQEDAGAYSATWATNISPGPANEASQTVTFTVSNTNTSIFDVQPSISSAGVLTFTPKSNKSGDASVTVTAADNGGTANGGVDESPASVFTISIDSQNDPPVAVDDAYTVLEGAILTTVPGGSPPGLLDNDTDADGDVLTGRIVQEPLHGTFSFINNGTLFYQHDGSEADLDSLKYVANDGTEDSNVATVILSIVKSNDPPVPNDIEDIIDQEDAPLPASIDLYAAFDDPDDPDQDLTFSVVGTTNDLLFQDLIVNVETGRLELIYAKDANGSSTITVQAADPGGLTATTSFKVTLTPVNDPPAMTPGPDITLDEDPGPQNIVNWAKDITPGPADEAGQIVSVSVVASNPALFSIQPQLTIAGTNGNLSFTPAEQAGGQSSVTITLTDNGGLNNTSNYTFLITIQGDNDKPTSLPIEDIDVNEDAETVTIDLFDYFDDVEDADESLIFTLEGEYDDALFENLSISSQPPRILTVDFATDAFGETTIGIRATDTGGLFAQEDVKITLNPVNDAPSFTSGGNVSVSQNSPAYSAQWAQDISVGPENESNQEAQFTVSIINGMENLFGVAPAISPEGVLTFTPAIGDQVFGTAEVSVILADNGGTENGGVSQSAALVFTISIRRLNTPPESNADNYIVDQGQTLQVGASIGVLANDTDPENDDLTARLISGPANAASFTFNADGSFTYRHNNTNSTSDAFTYVANDGFDDSNVTRVTISIQPSGTLALPEIVVLEDAEDTIVDVRSALALPVSGNEFTITNISNPSVFASTKIDTLSGVLTVSYAPNRHGEANINVTAVPAQGDPIVAKQKITILSINDPPIAVNDITATIQNRPIEIDVISNDVDYDDDNLTIPRFSNPTSGLVQAQSNGNLLYTPETDFTGIATFTYSVRDDSLATDEGLVTITVFSGRFVVSEMEISHSTTSAAYNISNAGEVVGASMTTGGAIQAFSSNQSIPFEAPSEAWGANDFGQIVGATTFEGTGNTGPVLQAALWDTSGVHNLGSLDGRSSKAYAINNSAQIIGVSTKQNSDVLHAVLWEDEQIYPMETEDAAESQAFDINEQGLTAGYVGQSAAVWRKEQILRLLQGAEGRAYAINGRGQAAGSIDDGTIKAVLWNDDGTEISLHMEGSSFSEAYGINNTSWVVGSYLPASSGKTSSIAARRSDVLPGSFGDGAGARKTGDAAIGSIADEMQHVNEDMRAFLWQGDAILDLNDFIDEASGWVLLEARAINNAAQITGVGLYHGERRAFLISPTINKAPTAIADAVSLTSLGPVTVDVLANDMDADGDTLRITSVSQGLFGQVSLESDYRITYVPGTAFTSSDAFTYVVEDGKGGIAEGHVEISLDAAGLPTQFTLAQNYPNPFNPQTTISFSLPEQTYVSLEVYNMLGQLVATLIDGVKPAGTHSIIFEAAELPGGVYMYRLKTERFEKSRQLVLLK